MVTLIKIIHLQNERIDPCKLMNAFSIKPF